MLIKDLPKESREKLVQAGFDENNSVNSHREVHAPLLGEYPMTPLTYAAREGDVDLTYILIKNGANVDLRDNSYNLTPLMWATWYARNKVVRCLLNREADANLTGKIPGYPEGTAYQYTKRIPCCGFTSLWYTAQKQLGYGDITKAQKALKFSTAKVR